MVELDNTATKTVAAIAMVANRAARLFTRLHVITGARISVTMKGVINARVPRLINVFEKT